MVVLSLKSAETGPSLGNKTRHPKRVDGEGCGTTAHSTWFANPFRRFPERIGILFHGGADLNGGTCCLPPRFQHNVTTSPSPN